MTDMAKNHEKAIKHYNLGITYSMQGRLDDAIKEYQMAIKYKPDFAEAHYDVGVDYFQLGRLDDAIREYELALKYNPNDAKARENLLQAKSMKGSLDEYVEGCREAIRLNPNNPFIYYNLGLALEKKGLLDDAIREYREALRIAPNNEYARCNLGLILIRKERLDEGMSELKEVLKINPSNINARLGLGSILALKGIFDQALDEFRFVLTTDPNNIDARTSIELALRERKRMQVKLQENNSSEKRQPAEIEKEMAEEQRFVDYEIYSNDEYGFSMYYPKGWNLDISHPRPGDIDLFVTFRGIGFEGVSLTVGPMGFTKFGVTKEELEFRGKEGLKEESPAQYGQTLISSRFITVDGIEAYEQIYTAISFNSIKCKIKQVGFFKDLYEYVLTFMAPIDKFNDIKSIFDKCIKSIEIK